MRLLPLIRDRRRPFRGQALVELALIAPILCLLMLGAIDLGRVWYAQVSLENAAREGAMEGMFKPTSFLSGQSCTSANKDTNRIMCRVLNEVRGSGVTVDAADVSKSCAAACAPGTTGSPNRIVVRVEGEFSLLTPLIAVFFGGQDVPLAAEAEATIVMTPTAGTVASPTPSPTPSPSPSATPAPTPSGSATPTPAPSATPTPTPQPCVAPSAAFTVSPTSGVRNVTNFQFTDQSTGMANSACGPIWSWSFGDGGGASSAQNPAYMYSKKGTYTVTLAVSNSAGTSQATRVINVTNN